MSWRETFDLSHHPTGMVIIFHLFQVLLTDILLIALIISKTPKDTKLIHFNRVGLENV